MCWLAQANADIARPLSRNTNFFTQFVAQVQWHFMDEKATYSHSCDRLANARALLSSSALLGGSASSGSSVVTLCSMPARSSALVTSLSTHAACLAILNALILSSSSSCFSFTQFFHSSSRSFQSSHSQAFLQSTASCWLIIRLCPLRPTVLIFSRCQASVKNKSSQLTHFLHNFDTFFAKTISSSHRRLQ